LCLFGLLLSLAPAQKLDESATRTLIEKIAAQRQAKPSLQAEYREEKSGGILGKPAISSGKLWYSTPNLFRKESRDANKESLIVSNGEVLWMYYPAFQQAERYDLKKHKFLSQGIAAFTTGLDFAKAEKDFTVTAEEAAGGYVLRLLPKKAAISRMLKQLEIKLSKDLELQSVETISPKGERTRTDLSKVSAEKIAPLMFEFTPPAGATVTSPLGK
jgi:chaperone LolA